MNGIEKIISHIQADSKNQTDEISAQTAARCREIEQEYAKKANDAYGKIILDGTAEAKLTVERLDSAAQLESKKRLLACKQELISRAFSKAVEAISALPEEDFTNLMAKLAAQCSVSGSEQIIMNPQQREKYGQSVCSKANELLRSQGKNAALTLS
ncbi:MAG: hypothetical protein IJ072_07670, partial [Oscillospiraceae bacterium]|nr:hypothetical protein [Oscillospiraceae bacterium]